MSTKVAFTCDVCGAERKETNHWFVVEVTNRGFHLHDWAWAVRECEIDKQGVKHVCGQACAHKLLDEFMSGGGQ